jgi:hypothetical protein
MDVFSKRTCSANATHTRAGYPSDLLNRLNRCLEKCLKPHGRLSRGDLNFAGDFGFEFRSSGRPILFLQRRKASKTILGVHDSIIPKITACNEDIKRLLHGNDRFSALEVDPAKYQRSL